MKSNFLRLLVSAVLSISLAACATLDYRQVQGDFADAVAADNQWSVSPFGANAAEGLYGGVQAELSNEYIAKLDARLRANAWLLRAVSQWRLGQLTQAHDSAQAGLRAVLPDQEGSRDHIMLSMMDGLIIDSDLHAKYRELGDGSLDLETYNRDFGPEFATGLAQLDAGYQLAGEATPAEVQWYYRYHRWRMLNNWSSVITKVEPREERISARSGAQSRVGGDLDDAAQREYRQLPGNHPLAELIRAKDPELGNP